MGRLGLVVVLIVACRFEPRGADEGPPDAAPGEIEIVLDSVDELAGVPPSAVLDLARVYGFAGGTKDGTVEPGLYAIGAVHAEGQNARVYDDIRVDADFDAHYDAANVVGRNLLATARLAGRPAGLGIPDANFTVWIQGEMFLEPGTHQIQLQVDHDGFLDLFGPFNATGVVKVLARFNEDLGASGLIDVPIDTAGWYAFRAAWSNDSGPAAWTIVHGVNGAGRTPIEPWRVRARADDLQGALIAGFDELQLTRANVHARAIDPTPFVDAWSPSNVSITGLDNPGMSFRHAAQVRITEDGMYTFAVETDGAYRLWIDGARVSDGDSFTTSTAPVTAPLTVGWHDVALDVTRDTTDGTVSLTMGPMGGALAPIDPARTRPSVGITSRTQTFADATLRVFSGATNVPFQIDVTPDAAAFEPTQLDVAMIADPDDWTQLKVDLIVGATSIRIFDEPASQRTGTNTVFLHVPAAQLAGIPAGTWVLRYTSPSASVLATALTVHHRGGAEAVPLVARYESPVVDFGSPLGVSLVAADGASSATLEARACRSATDCDAYVSADNLAAIATTQLAQVRVTLTSDGATAPIADAIRIRAKPR